VDSVGTAGCRARRCVPRLHGARDGTGQTGVGQRVQVGGLGLLERGAHFLDAELRSGLADELAGDVPARFGIQAAR